MLDHRAALRGGLLVLLAACTADSGSLLAPEPGGPGFLISDAAHAGTVPGFYFLPPMVPQPVYNGTFDAALSPRVEVCELAGTSCATTIATFTTSSGPGGQVVTVNPTTETYAVNWHTDLSNLDPAKHYRISVYVGSFLLGFADVDAVSSGKELKYVDTDDFIPLVDGRTLPIKFRIETGIVASVVVSPATASINSGSTQQFTATLTDLHGNPVAATVTWSSSAPAVATVDQNGLATGVSPGTAIITATSGGASGSATLTVLNPNTAPVGVDDAFDAIGNVTVPVAAPGVLANDTDAENNTLSVASPGTYPTANGGTVTLNADGSFTYLSAAGFEGSDSFTYAASDGSLTSGSTTVTMTVAEPVWYVRNNAAAPGDGRDASPFTELKSAETASDAGETIFLLAGDGSTTGYDAGIILKAGQALTGQGVTSNITAVVNGQPLVLLASGSTPQVTRSTAGATIQLASNNTVQGVSVASTAGAGIAGTGFGTLTAGDLSVSAVGGPALDLQTGTVAASFGSLSSSDSPGAGVRLHGISGSLSAAGGTITGADSYGIDISGGSVSVTLASVSVQNSALHGINAVGGGSLSVTGGTISGNGDDGVQVAGGATSVSVSGATFTANRGDHFQATASGSTGLTVTFANNTLSGGHPSALGQGITIGTTGSYTGALSYDVAGNQIVGSVTHAVTVSLASTAGSASGKVRNNTIGAAGASLSCSTQGSGIAVDARGSGTHTVSVTGNVIRNCFDRGIQVFANDGSGTLNVTATGNTVAELTGASSREGFFLQAGSFDPNSFGASDSHFVCVTLGGAGSLANSLVAGPSAATAARLRQRFSTTVRLPGYAGGATDTGAVAAFVSANNGGASASATVSSPPGGGFVGGAACPTP